MKEELERLKKVIERVTGIDDIFKKSRETRYIIPRALFCSNTKKHICHNVSEIGRFSGLNHATVLNALNKIETYERDFPEYSQIEKKVCLYYKNVLGTSLGEDQYLDLETIEEIQRLEKLNDSLEKRLFDMTQRANRTAKNLIPFTKIPEDKVDQFIESRLNPWLIMNA